MAKTAKDRQKKYKQYQQALRNLAPDKTFGRITLAEFEAQIAKSEAPRADLERIDDEKKAAEAKIEFEDKITMKMCDKIKNGVVDDDDFGDDSALYESLGYVRKSERKSGLTRKNKKGEPSEQ
ncbi:MAG: hypothetical protein LUM44_14455 [Pyrinomonadaceae bacterium]|nr:hypothetical protein [Pyrinomonadaceae bacterium]